MNERKGQQSLHFIRGCLTPLALVFITSFPSKLEPSLLKLWGLINVCHLKNE